MPQQPTSKLTSARLIKKPGVVPAQICVYLSVKEWVCVTKLHVVCSVFFFVFFSKCPSTQLVSYRQLSCGTVSILYVDAFPGLVLTTFL